ncbi:MAG: hypothetical protein JXB49_32155 [Bacteroidales bacterium]|nr:hypothetical protein [Bacteroidales bacterium]
MTDIENKICYLCGKNGADSVDHIPPKALFHKRYRDSNLLTVPAHSGCNNSCSKNDEYFRDNLVIAASSVSSAAKELFNDKIVRAFMRKEAAGYRKMFVDQMSTVNILNSTGISKESLPIKVMDCDRINSVVNRTCRGIYYHTHSSVLKLDCPVNVDMAKPEAINIRHKLNGTPILKVIIPEVFEYTYLVDKNDLESNSFFLFFYNCFTFHVSTGKICSKIPRVESKQKYSKLEGITFTNDTLWSPPGTQYD